MGAVWVFVLLGWQVRELSCWSVSMPLLATDVRLHRCATPLTHVTPPALRPLPLTAPGVPGAAGAAQCGGPGGAAAAAPRACGGGGGAGGAAAACAQPLRPLLVTW